MITWWHRDVLGAGKLPLLLCFLALVVTFAVTRTITRMIRAGRGSFRDQVSTSGVHVHHAVPGVIALTVGAFTAVGSPPGPWRAGAGVLVGAGVSLVLDEFALILRLQDVYWSGEGRLSVDMITLTAACLGLALVGLTPLGVDEVGGTELAIRLGASAVVVLQGLLVLACVLKGKYRLALFGLFVPTLALVGATRLARPDSPWARRRYRPRRLAEAYRRAGAFDRRWRPVLTGWDNLIGGAPSRPDPGPTTPESHRDPGAG